MLFLGTIAAQIGAACAHAGALPHSKPSGSTRAPNSTRLQVVAFSPLNGRDEPPSGGRIDLSVSEGPSEDITVYAKRRGLFSRLAPPPEQPLRVGPAEITGSTESERANYNGMTVTGALPMRSIPGLEAVATLSGGHDQVTASTAAADATVTAGFRLRF